MNKTISKILGSSVAALLLLPAVGTLQSCSSDEENLLDEYCNIQSAITITYGETVDIITLKNQDEEVLVVPAVIGNLTITSDNEKVVRINRKNQLVGEDAGTANILITNANNEVIKEVKATVIPTFSLTLKSGDRVALSDYLTEEQANSTLDCSASSVATIKNGYIYALNPGSAIIKNRNGIDDSKVMIEVNVEPYTTTELFPLPWLPYNAYGTSINQVKSEMSAYTPEYEGAETFEGRSYTALRYKPYSSGCVLTYYFEEYYISSALKYVIIDTQKDSDYTYRYLMSNYKCYLSYFSQNFEVQYFNTGTGYWRFFPYNGSWSKLQLKTYN